MKRRIEHMMWFALLDPRQVRQSGQQRLFVAYVTACAAFCRREAGGKPASATLSGRWEFL
jgi:hypothetical protein